MKFKKRKEVPQSLEDSAQCNTNFKKSACNKIKAFGKPLPFSRLKLQPLSPIDALAYRKH